jgi:type I restriction enzyme S subunit
MPNALPNGWTRARLDDLTAKTVAQGGPAGPFFIYVDISAIDNTRKSISDPKELDTLAAPSRARQQIRAGDVLVSMTRPNLNAVAKVPPELDGAIASTGFAVLRPIEVHPDWVFSHVRSKSFVESMTALVRGALYPAVRPADVRQYEIPLPPLNEQRRIVAKLEALQERTRNAREALEAIPPLIEKFRQSILAAAFRGDLTADWRAKNPDVEPASLLLDRIGKERRKKKQEAELAKMKARGKSPIDDRWKAGYVTPPSIDATDLPDLPNGWCWTTVDEAGDVLLGRQRAPQYLTGLHSHKYLRVANIKDDRIDFSDLEEMDFDPRDFAKYRLQDGDILVSEGQSPELVGQSAVFRGEVADLCFQKTLHRFRPLRGGPSASYAQYVFRHHVRQGVFRSLAPITTNIAHLTLERFQRSPFPLAPALEQAEIVRRLDLAFAAIEKVVGIARAELERVAQLESSILAKAFRGELVPQESNDEPASVLLERIRAEREQQQPQASRGRRTRRSTTDPPADVNNDECDEQDDIDSEAEAASSPATASRKPRAEAAERQSPEPEERPRASIDDYILEDILAAFRPVMPTASRYDRDDVIRAVARHLGFDRAGSRIREAIESTLPTAARRHIAWYSGTEVWIATRTITDYTRDELKDYFLAAIGSTWHDRPEAIRLATRYLGFTRTGPNIEDTWKSIINGLIRTGQLDSDGSRIRST